MTMQAPPPSATAVGAELQPAQRIGDLDVFFTERGLRIARDPAPWGRVLKYGLVFGAVIGVWGIVALGIRTVAIIGFVAGVLGVALVMRRRVLIEVRGDLLRWQDTGRFFGRGLHTVALNDVGIVRVGPRPSLLLEQRDGRAVELLPGMHPALLQQVGILIEGHLDRRR